MTYLGNVGAADSVVRCYTSTQWTAANYDLRPDQLGVESDTGKIKVGVGKKWSSTSYVTVPTSTAGTTVVIDILDGTNASFHHLTFENGILTQYTTSANN